MGLVGLAWKERHPGPRSNLARARVLDPRPTLLEFMGALFGRELTRDDRADLGERLDLLRTEQRLAHDCDVLARCLDEAAAQRGTASFVRAGSAQQESIVNEIMEIDPKAKLSRVLMRFSRSEREYFQMRWSAVPQLIWLYRHSSVAWRARGYRRWPGVSGNWHDVLVPGPAYP